MTEKKIKNTKTEIFSAFRKLGWDFRHRGCGFYSFITPKKEELKLQMWFPQNGERPCRVEYEFEGTIDFELDRCHFIWLDEDMNCISLCQDRIKDPPCFINFNNFNLNETHK